MLASSHRALNAVDVYWLPRIRVVDHPLGFALADGHVQGVGHQRCGQVVSHGPADHPPGPDIDHNPEVEEPCLGRDVGYVRHPGSVWSVSCELSLHQVRRCRTFGVSPGSGHFTAAVNALDAGLTHEPGHPLAAHSHTLGGQLGMHTGRTVGAPRPAVNLHNPVPQLPIRLPANGRAPAQPCVVATGRAHPTGRTCAARDGRPDLAFTNAAAA